MLRPLPCLNGNDFGQSAAGFYGNRGKTRRSFDFACILREQLRVCGGGRAPQGRGSANRCAGCSFQADVLMAHRRAACSRIRLVSTVFGTKRSGRPLCQPMSGQSCLPLRVLRHEPARNYLDRKR